MAAELIDISNILGIPLYLLMLIIVWSLIWKGAALWKSARAKHIVWFILILVINTIGILEILYIYLFSKIDWNENKKGKAKKSTRIRRKKW